MTVSVGVIQGGVKINVLPGDCRMEVDIRLPVGVTHKTMLAEVERIVARYPEARVTPVWTHSAEPTVSDPEHRMIGILQETVRGLTGQTPVPAVSMGASDCKH